MQKNFQKIKEILRKWGRGNKSIRKVYIYGSFAKGKFTKNSDLDIAVVLDPSEGDTNALTTWICDKEKLEEELQLLLPEYKVHSEWYDGDGKETPNVKAGIMNSGILMYSKND